MCSRGFCLLFLPFSLSSVILKSAQTNVYTIQFSWGELKTKDDFTSPANHYTLHFNSMYIFSLANVKGLPRSHSHSHSHIRIFRFIGYRAIATNTIFMINVMSIEKKERKQSDCEYNNDVVHCMCV